MDDKNQKKTIRWKGVLPTLFFLLIGMICGAFIGVFIRRLTASDASFIETVFTILFFLLIIYAAVFCQLIIHEAGHLVFGLLSGYKFSSFRIGSFMWIKKDDGVRFCKFSIAGTSGQCLMSPPELKNGKFSYILYNLGGSLMNTIISFICLILFILCGSRLLLSLLFIEFSVIGFAIALMNGIPMRLGGIDNDGYNTIALHKSPAAIRTFWLQMKMNEQLIKGIRLKDMPEEWFEMPSSEELRNSVAASAAIFACNRMMDNMDFEKAHSAIKELLQKETALVGLYRILLDLDSVYCELIGGKREAPLAQMEDPSVKKILKTMKNFPSILRIQYTYALLAERNFEKAAEFKRKFERVALNYPYSGDIAGERELIEYAEKKAFEADI